MNSHPKVFTVTAPSGTGKTTLNRQLVAEFAEIEMSISYTTRQQRRNETNGDHYWFISQEEFDRQIKKDLMLEWAKVFDYYYGTSLQELKRIAIPSSILLCSTCYAKQLVGIPTQCLSEYILCFWKHRYHKRGPWPNKKCAPGEDRTLDLQIALYL